MIKILVADPLAKQGMAKIEAMSEVQADVKTGLNEDQLAAVVGEYDGMIIRSGVKITAKVLANPGRLRAIARAGVGVDNVDLPAATKAGILVMNTPDANTLSTAEHAMALMLALSRQIPAADAHARESKWNRKKFSGTQVGMGRIGSAVAKRLLAFEMRVMGYDPALPAERWPEGVMRAERLEALLPQCDFVTLHVPLTEGTRHLIGARELALLPQTAFFVNAARGEVVDEAALIQALRQGRLAGAGIDVFAEEPPAKDHPFFQMDNVIVTPHNSALTAQAAARMAVDAARGIHEVLSGGPVTWPVNA